MGCSAPATGARRSARSTWCRSAPNRRCCARPWPGRRATATTGSPRWTWSTATATAVSAPTTKRTPRPWASTWVNRGRSRGRANTNCRRCSDRTASACPRSCTHRTTWPTAPSRCSIPCELTGGRCSPTSAFPTRTTRSRFPSRGLRCTTPTRFRRRFPTAGGTCRRGTTRSSAARRWMSPSGRCGRRGRASTALSAPRRWTTRG